MFSGCQKYQRLRENSAFIALFGLSWVKRRTKLARKQQKLPRETLKFLLYIFVQGQVIWALQGDYGGES